MVVPEAQNQQNMKNIIYIYYMKMACTQNVAGCFICTHDRNELSK